MFNPETIAINNIIVPEGRRAIDEDTVETLSNSMEKIGLHTPITVRRNDDGKIILVAGAHRLAAAGLLGWEKINCFALECSEDEADMWEIAENLHRADLTVLQRSEQIAKWVEIANRVSAQVAQKPQGGRPESGNSKAARDLNLERSEVSRAVKLSKLSPEAKKAAVTIGLDDNQSALLAAARAEYNEQAQALQAFAAARMQPRATIPELRDWTAVEDDQLRKLMTQWNASSPAVKQRFLDKIDRRAA